MNLEIAAMVSTTAGIGFEKPTSNPLRKIFCTYNIFIYLKTCNKTKGLSLRTLLYLHDDY